MRLPTVSVENVDSNDRACDRRDCDVCNRKLTRDTGAEIAGSGRGPNQYSVVIVMCRRCIARLARKAGVTS